MSDLIERLRDEEYRGPLQHLRSYSDLDKLHDEAADAIAAKDREIAELRAAIQERRDIYAHKADAADPLGEDCYSRHEAFAHTRDAFDLLIDETATTIPTPDIRQDAKDAQVIPYIAAAIRSLGKEGSGE